MPVDYLKLGDGTSACAEAVLVEVEEVVGGTSEERLDVVKPVWK